MVSAFRQKWQVADLNVGISLSKKIGNKATYQSPLQDITKVGALCIKYDLFTDTY